jgi:hypothetical protein
LRNGRLLLTLDTSITCPSCAHDFSLQEGFAKRALERLEDASANAIAAMREAERAQVEKRAEQLVGERTRAAQNEAEALKILLREQAEAHAGALAGVRALAEKSFAPRLQEMAEIAAAERASFMQQLAERDRQVAMLRDEQLLLRREREHLKDEKAALSLEVQRQVEAQLRNREAVIRTQEQERASLEKAELQKKLNDAGEQLAAAQRKMEQGSQQLQGEVLEIAIEEGLKRAFPLDTIEEVKKGQRGGDVLQHVVTRTGQTAGTILWETKRAKDWSANWVPKLKEDMRACGAAVAILVTMPGALPKEWPESAYFALHQDVWVTQASCAVGIAEALRVGLLDLHRQRAVSAGKGEKMEAMYDYLTSPQFAQKLKAVYETFKKMRDELESEKNVTTQRWARREKQLQGGMTQLLSIGGEIQGLAQEELPMLEMEPQRDMPL